MTPPLRYAHYHNPPWEYDVVVAHGPLEKANRLIANITGEQDIIGRNCQGFCFTPDGYPVVVWTYDLKSTTTLVHELMHATFHILRHRGLRLSEESEETYTYTLGSLLSRILVQKKWMTLK